MIVVTGPSPTLRQAVADALSSRGEPVLIVAEAEVEAAADTLWLHRPRVLVVLESLPSIVDPPACENGASDAAAGGVLLEHRAPWVAALLERGHPAALVVWVTGPDSVAPIGSGASSLVRVEAGRLAPPEVWLPPLRSRHVRIPPRLPVPREGLSTPHMIASAVARAIWTPFVANRPISARFLGRKAWFEVATSVGLEPRRARPLEPMLARWFPLAVVQSPTRPSATRARATIIRRILSSVARLLGRRRPPACRWRCLQSACARARAATGSRAKPANAEASSAGHSR